MSDSGNQDHSRKPDRSTEEDTTAASDAAPVPSRRPRRAGTPSKGPTRRRTRIGARALIETVGPSPADPVSDVRLTIGTIGGTHGVDGELKLRVLTDQPDHLPNLTRVFLGNSDVPTRLEGVRFHGDMALIKLEGINTPEQGKPLGGLQVRIAGEDARPLEADEYFLFQLIGLEARDENGAVVGTVTDLIETGAHDVLVITPTGGDRSSEILVPNHPEFVNRIAPEEGEIEIRLPRYE